MSMHLGNILYLKPSRLGVVVKIANEVSKKYILYLLAHEMPRCSPVQLYGIPEKPHGVIYTYSVSIEWGFWTASFPNNIFSYVSLDFYQYYVRPMVISATHLKTIIKCFFLFCGP